MNNNLIRAIGALVCIGAAGFIGKTIGSFCGRVEGNFDYIDIQKERINRIKRGESKSVLEELGRSQSQINDDDLIKILDESIEGCHEKLKDLRNKYPMIWKLKKYEERFIEL